MDDGRFLRENPNPVPLDALTQPEYDVREYRTDKDIDNIRRSMEDKGQVMPVLLGGKDGGTYPILDGNHRYLAAKRAGWPNIDAIQTGAGIQDDEAQILANISRLELTQGEKLATVDYMLSVLDYSKTEAADAVGWTRSQMTKYGSILDGYGEIQEYYVEGEIGLAAAYQLNQVDDRDRAVDIAQTATREGYQDADIVTQAKNARSDDSGEDVMRGAGTEANISNMQQVRRNAEAMQDLDPRNPAEVDEATVAGSQTPREGPQAGDGESESEPQGPPCMACAEPTQAGHMMVVEIHPQLAEQVGIQELRFGAECSGRLLKWWSERQQESNVETDEQPDPADTPKSG